MENLFTFAVVTYVAVVATFGQYVVKIRWPRPRSKPLSVPDVLPSVAVPSETADPVKIAYLKLMASFAEVDCKLNAILARLEKELVEDQERM